MKTINIIILLVLANNIFGQKINKSLSYPEVIAKYKSLDSASDEARIFPYGKTDSGELLQLFVISQSKIFEPQKIHELNKCILFINNGIHPGEPDGIDASLELATNLLSNPIYKKLLENVVVCILPVFNIDGALERGCCSRANQNGPEEYGFRANSRNLDLNRDFTKTDALSTRSLLKIFLRWDPDVLVDTHVSDGADYQYNISLIATQHNKLNSLQGPFIKEEFTPALFEKMKSRNDEMIPYVQTREENEIPDSGIVGFLETPRFFCGYASLINTLSFISESHMLKPFDQRKKSTLNLLISFMELCNEKHDKILSLRKKANENQLIAKKYFFNWECDTTKKEKIDFKGYQAMYKKSEVTGGQRLFYDENKPYKKQIDYYDEYYPLDSIVIPKYFLIPQAWYETIDLLEINRVSFVRSDTDSVTTASVTYIDSYETVKEPYEGHYLHYNVKTHTENQKVKIKKGDYLIPMPQKNMRYALETLIPKAVDSYFCWGFYDSFLQQKEWFSSYVYEDVASNLLKKNKDLKKDFDKWKSENPSADEYSQLNFIYQHSPNFEKSYRRYPIFSIY